MKVDPLRSARLRPLHGAHVLAIVVAFFAVVVVVNGAMIYAALSTHTGLVASEPYRKGLHYNERIAANVRQSGLGWLETLSVRRDGHVAFTLAASDGRPITGLRVLGMLGRPSTDRHDIALALSEAAPGRYEAHTQPLADGMWLIELDARRNAAAEDPVYRTRKRLWLTQQESSAR
jgi:nitrogen fixation protein FixH